MTVRDRRKTRRFASTRSRLIVAAVCALLAAAAIVLAAAPWAGGSDQWRAAKPAFRPFFSVSLA